VEEVTQRAGQKVFVEVENNRVLIVSDLQRILDQHLKPRLISSLSIFFYNSFLK
jgi:hypothetical protein